MKNSLGKNGLSMSDAQSVSNLCNQRATDIGNSFSNINNVSKKLKIDNVDYVETEGVPLPDDTLALLKEKAGLHAVQAFLMENLKAKEARLKEIKNKPFVYDVEAPKREKGASAEFLKEVNEDWGKEQLSLDEINELLSVESEASHIGQFIHKNSVLDKLRKELPTIKTLEWIVVKDGEKTPLIVTKHHTPEKLSTLHEELSAVHRNAEKRVNYFKAKIKNLVTIENARIAKANSIEQNRVNAINQKINEEFSNAYSKWSGEYSEALQEFEAKRNEEIQEVAALKITVPELFKPLVDKFLESIK
jgi:hypothetical protein